MKIFAAALALFTTFAISHAQAACYQVRCVSDAGRALTLKGNVDQHGVLVHLSPSKGSAWVVQIQNKRVIAAQNCYPDQLVDSGNGGVGPDHDNSALCQTYGPKTGISPNAYGTVATFEYGAWKEMKSCGAVSSCN